LLHASNLAAEYYFPVRGQSRARGAGDRVSQQQGARPIRRNDGRIGACCARAASGHETAAPPRSVMNSRRFNRLPRRPSSVSGTSRPSALVVFKIDRELIFRWLLKREIARLFAALSSHGLPACDVRSAVRGQVSHFLKE
jgi:hypothetical protein